MGGDSQFGIAEFFSFSSTTVKAKFTFIFFFNFELFECTQYIASSLLNEEYCRDTVLFGTQKGMVPRS